MQNLHFLFSGSRLQKSLNILNSHVTTVSLITESLKTISCNILKPPVLPAVVMGGKNI